MGEDGNVGTIHFEVPVCTVCSVPFVATLLYPTQAAPPRIFGQPRSGTVVSPAFRISDGALVHSGQRGCRCAARSHCRSRTQKPKGDSRRFDSRRRRAICQTSSSSSQMSTCANWCYLGSCPKTFCECEIGDGRPGREMPHWLGDKPEKRARRASPHG